MRWFRAVAAFETAFVSCIAVVVEQPAPAQFREHVARIASGKAVDKQRAIAVANGKGGAAVAPLSVTGDRATNEEPFAVAMAAEGACDGFGGGHNALATFRANAVSIARERRQLMTRSIRPRRPFGAILSKTSPESASPSIPLPIGLVSWSTLWESCIMGGDMALFVA